MLNNGTIGLPFILMILPEATFTLASSLSSVSTLCFVVRTRPSMARGRLVCVWQEAINLKRDFAVCVH